MSTMLTLCPKAFRSPIPVLSKAFCRSTSPVAPCLQEITAWRPTPCPRHKQLSGPRSRFFSTSPRRTAITTVEQAKARAKFGPFSIWGAVTFLATGIGLVYYFRAEKARVERRRTAEASKGVGKPLVGGEFELIDQDGKTFTHKDLLGGYSLVYFGFSHCPDICPEELDKMANMIDLVADSRKNRIGSSYFVDPSASTIPLLPIVITCDPARDTPAVLKHYLAEFHPGLVGLTGTWKQIKDVCKKYRVYFSTPEGVTPGMDYLVDHSIYFYLMDPEGHFVEAIGKEHTAERAAKIILDHMSDWKRR